MRGGSFLIIGIGIPVTVYVAYTLIGIGGPAGRSIGGVPRASYLLVSMAAFGAMTTAIGIAAGRFGASAALAGRRLAGRAGSALLLAVVPIFLLALIGIVGGLRWSGVRWGTLVAWLWVGVLPLDIGRRTAPLRPRRRQRRLGRGPRSRRDPCSTGRRLNVP